MSAGDNKRQLVVIGGGPGGYAAAFMGADLGMNVTLIDPEKNPGGVCLYRGCIPSKALLHVSKLIMESREAKNWGVTFAEPKINIKKMRGWKEEVVDGLTGGLGQLAKQKKIEHIRGTAKFLDAHSLEITKSGGGKEKISFEKAVLATGSRPATIPNLAIDSHRILDSTSALDIDEIPSSLLVVGGGYIGLELGLVYASLGSKVTVAEMLPGLLPGADRDLVRVLEKRLNDVFDSIMLETKVAEMKEQKNGIKATFDSKSKNAKKSGVFDKVLVAIGRRPNSNDIGLENTKVELDKYRFVKVDLQRKTAEDSIYAIGDIAGEPMLAHKATAEGRAAVEAIAGKKVAFEPQAIPAVVFTDPEIAWCGLTESEAREQKREIEVARFPWAASGRARTLGVTDGVTKLIVDPNSKRLLGMGIAGPGAGEMIAEGVLAIEMGANAADIGLTIHPHPTLTETVMEAADLIYGHATHFHRAKRK